MKLSDKIKTVNLSDIRPYKNNPKEHNDEQIKLIKNSIQRHTYIQPIAVDKNNEIVIGHGRYFALQEINPEMEIEVIDLSYLSSKEIKKLRILDNKSNESEWISSSLAKELDGIYKKSNIDSINIDEVGLSSREIDEILSSLRGDEKEDIEDDIPDIPECLAIETGDIVELGKHRLMCGDSTIKDNVDKLLNKYTIDLLVTDPPYNVNYSSKNELLNLCGKGNCLQRDIKSDKWKNNKQYVEWVKLWFEHIKNNMSDYNSIYIFGNYESLMSLYNLFKISNMLVWVKNCMVLGRQDYKGQHEFIAYGWLKHHKWYGQNNAVTVINYNKPIKNELHPTMKPVGLLEILINNSSQNNIICYDPFFGSGSALIACEKTGRICYGMEIDQHYCSVIIERYCQYTNQWDIRINGNEVSWGKYKAQHSKEKSSSK